MENATKALIIAGAILISIVLISVGVSIVTGATGTIDEGLGQMDQQEKNMFNQRFEGYEGRQTGTQVKSLLSQINSNNLANYEIEGKLIEIVFENITTASLTATSPIKLEDPTDPEAVSAMSSNIANLRAAINTGATYTVTLTYGSNGLIKIITIEKNNIN